MDKYNVKTYNSISHLGLEKLKMSDYQSTLIKKQMQYC